MSTSTESAPIAGHEPSAGVVKFYAQNDDLDAVQSLARRVFFEFLRTKPELTEDEISILYSVGELLFDLAVEHRKAA